MRSADRQVLTTGLPRARVRQHCDRSKTGAAGVVTGNGENRVFVAIAVNEHAAATMPIRHQNSSGIR